MQISVEDPATPDVSALLQEHLQDMALHSPPESVHALDLPALQAANITFFAARATQTAELLGCAALKQRSNGAGEIKSMRTAHAHQRKGVAAGLLRHLIQIAADAGMGSLSLETGTPDAFQPARELYLRYGFKTCPPFDDYPEDPYSVCMRLELPSRNTTE